MNAQYQIKHTLGMLTALFLLTLAGLPQPGMAASHSLTLSITGNGSVSSTPAGINCGNSCQASFAKGSSIRLTASPANGWKVKRWGSGCTGSSGNTCTIKISQNRTATVTFEKLPTASHTLSLTRVGSGTVTSVPAGINCGNACQASFTKGTSVHLSASPASGWKIKRWGSGCTGSSGNSCIIKISQDRSATVTFEKIAGPPSATLRFDSSDGPMTKTIVQNSGALVRFAWKTENLAANTSCRLRRLPDNASVTTLSPTTGGTWESSTIHAWNAGVRTFYLSCERNGALVTASDGINLTINRPIQTHTLTIQKSGSGEGNVSSNPIGVTCGSTCSAAFAKDVSVTLTATTANELSRFLGWAGACTGTESSCTIKMSSNRHVEAMFEKIQGDVHAISAGGRHSCAIRGSGRVACWGSNVLGQLGNNTWNDSLVPDAVIGLNNIKKIVTGDSHGCAIENGGTVVCWGYEYEGVDDAGDSFVSHSLAPTAVEGPFAVSAIAAGFNHTCAQQGDNTISCWGEGSEGQLGTGDSTTSPTPMTVLGVTDTVEIAAGGSHTCVLKTNGMVICWGSNWSGQLGHYGPTDHSPPMPVAQLSGATAIAAGFNHTCALKNDGTAACWGSNIHGQLGDGSSVDHILPKTVSGLADAVAISAGGTHTCAIRMGGTVVCWGQNHRGQLGTGTTVSQAVPSQVIGLNHVMAISSGNEHTCALKTNGMVSCWGSNTFGQLGDGGTTDKLTPDTDIDFSLMDQ